ncbi:hypothetical protein OHB14_13210 [Streptomyces sp. NBC_01613]|uniref:hypothetical protein n=1 Tax=Streptomyces sp. NBC_01613 TaxID=2975896 RepID=UPI0038632BEA
MGKVPLYGGLPRVTMGPGPPNVASRPPDPKAMPMNGSRIPGLVLPVLCLLALVVGAVWYWRHRDDE